MRQSGSKSRIVNRPAPDYFVVLKNGKLLDIRVQGRLDGKAQLPETSATRLSDAETAIVGQFEGEHLNAAEAAQAALNDDCAAVRGHVARFPQLADLDNIVDESRSHIERALLGNVELHRRLEDYRAHLAARRHFPREHNLMREPSYPASRVLHFTPLAVLLLIETGLNGFFFAEHDPLGLLGGVARAIWIAGTNVACSALFGFFALRYVNRPQTRVRVVIATAVYVLSALAFNLAAACYRDAYALGAGIVRPSLFGLFHSVGALSFQSFLMFAAGLVTCGLALHKGYTGDDPYPGYGQIDRDYLASRSALDEAAERAKRDLLARDAAIEAAVDRVVAHGEELFEQADERLGSAQQTDDSYDADRARLQDRTKIYLTSYRGENRFYRHSPPPAYFETYPEFASLLDRTPLPAAQQQLALAKSTVDALKARRAEIKAAGPLRAAAIAQRFHEFIMTGNWLPASPETPRRKGPR